MATLDLTKIGSTLSLNAFQPPPNPIALTSQNTQSSTPISVTPKPDNTNYAGMIAGATQQAQTYTTPSGAKVDASGKLVSGGQDQQPTQNQQGTFDIKSYIDSITGVQQPNATQTYQQGYDQSGLAQQQADVNAKAAVTAEAQGRLNNISAQLQALNTEATAVPIQLQQDSEGRGRTASGIAPLQADKLREIALRALPLQAQAAVIQAEVATAQGNQKLAQDLYTQAQDHFDKMFTLQMQDAQNKYDFQTNLIDKVYEFADRNEQRQLDAIAAQKKQDFEAQQNEINFNHNKELTNIKAAADIKAAAAGNPSLPPPSQDLNNAKTVQDLGNVNLINNVLSSPDFASAFGIKGTVNQYIPGSPAQKVIADVQQIKDILSLAARGQLKGQGQISDFEGRMLANAQTALNGNLSAEDAKQALINVRGAILTSSGGSTNVAITDPKTGVTKIGQANSAIITQAIASGYRVTYQP